MSTERELANNIAAKAATVMTRAVVQFLCDLQFLGELAMRLVKVSQPGLGTMATDGRQLFYDPAFVQGIKPDEALGVVAHEVFHCVCRHVGSEGAKRRGERDQECWDQAMEFKVNSMVIACGFQLPGKYYYDKKYDDTWSTEAIYQDIKKNGLPEICKDMKGSGKGGQRIVFGLVDSHDKFGSDGDGSAEDIQKLDSDWKNWTAAALNNAMNNSKARGKFPAGLKRLIEDMLEPKLPWRQILVEFVRSFSKDDLTFRRANRKHLWRGLYMPSLHCPAFRVAFAMDTSGSMTDKDLAEGYAELQGILGAFASYHVYLFGCDAAVHFFEELTPYNEVDISGVVTGGGGTDFCPVFDRIAEEQLDIDALVYFTDTAGVFPDEPPPYPVLWVVKGNGDVPWGRVCRMED